MVLIRPILVRALLPGVWEVVGLTFAASKVRILDVDVLSYRLLTSQPLWVVQNTNSTCLGVVIVLQGALLPGLCVSIFLPFPQKSVPTHLFHVLCYTVVSPLPHNKNSNHLFLITLDTV
jgi:hypothetical protein